MKHLADEIHVAVEVTPELLPRLPADPARQTQLSCVRRERRPPVLVISMLNALGTSVLAWRCSFWAHGLVFGGGVLGPQAHRAAIVERQRIYKFRSGIYKIRLEFINFK